VHVHRVGFEMKDNVGPHKNAGAFVSFVWHLQFNVLLCVCVRNISIGVKFVPFPIFWPTASCMMDFSRERLSAGFF
jgi:hypothetical protein